MENDGFKVLHTFRSKVLSIAVINERVVACTERVVYVQQKNGKRWRKLKHNEELTGLHRTYGECLVERRVRPLAVEKGEVS